MDDQMQGAVLGREDLLALIAGEQRLLSNYLDLEQQVQPNGVDLSLQTVSAIHGQGILAADNAGRVLPDVDPLPFDDDGFVTLGPGVYQVVFNEIVNLPKDMMAFGRPRSSLCRCGVTLHTAVWDAGYNGRSTSLLNVANPSGFRVQRDARLLQLVFIKLAREVAEGYRGIYQGENIRG